MVCIATKCIRQARAKCLTLSHLNPNVQALPLGQRFLIEQRKFNANGFSCGGASALTHFHFLMARPTTGELDADVQRVLSNYLPENTCINVLQELQHVCVAAMRRKIAPLWGGGGDMN